MCSRSLMEKLFPQRNNDTHWTIDNLTISNYLPMKNRIFFNCKARNRPVGGLNSSPGEFPQNVNHGLNTAGLTVLSGCLHFTSLDRGMTHGLWICE